MQDFYEWVICGADTNPGTIFWITPPWGGAYTGRGEKVTFLQDVWEWVFRLLILNLKKIVRSYPPGGLQRWEGGGGGEG